MTLVYIWPHNIGGSTLYLPATRLRSTVQWDGGPGQKIERPQRSIVEISGEIVRANAPDFDIMLDRLRGGLHFVGIWDFEQRKQNRWDLKPALNTNGSEFWRADGLTSLYAGESANPPTGPWRSIFGNLPSGGSINNATLTIGGLLANEVIPKGAVVRAGDFRYRTLTAATANGSGVATVTLSTRLRETFTAGSPVRVPGDFFVGQLIGQPDISQADVNGVRTFTVRLSEVYSDEVFDGTGFEFFVDDFPPGTILDPVTLIQSGGFYYPLDASHLFKDIALTMPVTADGDEALGIADDGPNVINSSAISGLGGLWRPAFPGLEFGDPSISAYSSAIDFSTGAGTLFARFRIDPGSITSPDYLMGRSSPPSSESHGLRTTNGVLEALFGGNVISDPAATDLRSDVVWHTAALTWGPTTLDTKKLYLDGVEVASAARTNFPGSGTTITIGGLGTTDSGSFSNTFLGDMSHVFIDKRQLSPQEILDLHVSVSS